MVPSIQKTALKLLENRGVVKAGEVAPVPDPKYKDRVLLTRQAFLKIKDQLETPAFSPLKAELKKSIGAFTAYVDAREIPEVMDYIHLNRREIAIALAKSPDNEVISLVSPHQRTLFEAQAGALDKGYLFNIDYFLNTPEFLDPAMQQLMYKHDPEKIIDPAIDLGEYDISFGPDAAFMDKLGPPLKIKTVFFGPQKNLKNQTGIDLSLPANRLVIYEQMIREYFMDAERKAFPQMLEIEESTPEAEASIQALLKFSERFFDTFPLKRVAEIMMSGKIPRAEMQAHADALWTELKMHEEDRADFLTHIMDLFAAKLEWLNRNVSKGFEIFEMEKWPTGSTEHFQLFHMMVQQKEGTDDAYVYPPGVSYPLSLSETNPAILGRAQKIEKSLEDRYSFSKTEMAQKLKDLFEDIYRQLVEMGSPDAQMQVRISRDDQKLIIRAVYEASDREGVIFVRKLDNKIEIKGFTAIAPESGAVKVEAFDAQGNPVPGVTVVPGSMTTAEVNLGGDWTKARKEVLDSVRAARGYLWKQLYPEKNIGVDLNRDLPEPPLPNFPVPKPEEIVQHYTEYDSEGWRSLPSGGKVPVGMVQLDPKVLNWYRGLISDFGRNLKILSIGSGRGQLEKALMEDGHQVTAVDISPENAKFAEALGVKTIVADAHQLPEPEEKSDLVISIDAMGQMKPEVIIAQAAKQLKEGGSLFITTPRTQTIMTEKEYEDAKFIRYPRAHIDALLRSAGFIPGNSGALPILLLQDPRNPILEYHTARLSPRSEARTANGHGLSSGYMLSKHYLPDPVDLEKVPPAVQIEKEGASTGGLRSWDTRDFAAHLAYKGTIGLTLEKNKRILRDFFVEKVYSDHVQILKIGLSKDASGEEIEALMHDLISRASAPEFAKPWTKMILLPEQKKLKNLLETHGFKAFEVPDFYEKGKPAYRMVFRPGIKERDWQSEAVRKQEALDIKIDRMGQRIEQLFGEKGDLIAERLDSFKEELHEFSRKGMVLPEWDEDPDYFLREFLKSIFNAFQSQKPPVLLMDLERLLEATGVGIRRSLKIGIRFAKALLKENLNNLSDEEWWEYYGAFDHLQRLFGQLFRNNQLFKTEWVTFLSHFEKSQQPQAFYLLNNELGHLAHIDIQWRILVEDLWMMKFEPKKERKRQMHFDLQMPQTPVQIGKHTLQPFPQRLTRVRTVPYSATKQFWGVRPDVRVLGLFHNPETGEGAHFYPGHVLDAFSFIHFYEQEFRGEKAGVLADIQSDVYGRIKANPEMAKTYKDWRFWQRLAWEHYGRMQGWRWLISPVAKDVIARWPKTDFYRGLDPKLAERLYDHSMRKLGYRPMWNQDIPWESGMHLTEAWVKELKPDDPIVPVLNKLFTPRDILDFGRSEARADFGNLKWVKNQSEEILKRLSETQETELAIALKEALDYENALFRHWRKPRPKEVEDLLAKLSAYRGHAEKRLAAKKQTSPLPVKITGHANARKAAFEEGMRRNPIVSLITRAPIPEHLKATGDNEDLDAEFIDFVIGQYAIPPKEMESIYPSLGEQGKFFREMFSRLYPETSPEKLTGQAVLLSKAKFGRFSNVLPFAFSFQGKERTAAVNIPRGFGFPNQIVQKDFEIQNYYHQKRRDQFHPHVLSKTSVRYRSAYLLSPSLLEPFFDEMQAANPTRAQKVKEVFDHWAKNPLPHTHEENLHVAAYEWLPNAAEVHFAADGEEVAALIWEADHQTGAQSLRLLSQEETAKLKVQMAAMLTYFYEPNVEGGRTLTHFRATAGDMVFQTPPGGPSNTSIITMRGWRSSVGTAEFIDGLIHLYDLQMLKEVPKLGKNTSNLVPIEDPKDRYSIPLSNPAIAFHGLQEGLIALYGKEKGEKLTRSWLQDYTRSHLSEPYHEYVTRFLEGRLPLEEDFRNLGFKPLRSEIRLNKLKLDVMPEVSAFELAKWPAGTDGARLLTPEEEKKFRFARAGTLGLIGINEPPKIQRDFHDYLGNLVLRNRGTAIDWRRVPTSSLLPDKDTISTDRVEIVRIYDAIPKIEGPELQVLTNFFAYNLAHNKNAQLFIQVNGGAASDLSQLESDIRKEIFKKREARGLDTQGIKVKVVSSETYMKGLRVEGLRGLVYGGDAQKLKKLLSAIPDEKKKDLFFVHDDVKKDDLTKSVKADELKEAATLLAALKQLFLPRQDSGHDIVAGSLLSDRMALAHQLQALVEKSA